MLVSSTGIAAELEAMLNAEPGPPARTDTHDIGEMRQPTITDRTRG